MSKILVIEDERDIRENLQEILELNNFEVVIAENGRQGIDLAKQEQPDLIICDVMMPKMNGYQVIQTLRQDSATLTIPFLFLTSKAEASDLRQGMDLGADDYLFKPVEAQTLLNAIATRLQKQEAYKQQAQKQLDELRNAISHSLPHEFNTPLTAIMGFSEMLMYDRSLLQQEDAQEMLEGIHSSAKRLYRLIKNFLLYTELELIAANPHTQKFLQKNNTFVATEAIIQSVATQKAQEYEREKDLRLKSQKAMVGISEWTLRKIVEEIVDNAFKFSTPGTPVQIQGASRTGKFVLSIVNEGRGMTPEQIEKIGAYLQFERRTYEQQGTGLGLALAKRMVELHRGLFRIQSIPGEKISVQIVLPASDIAVKS